MDNERKKEDFSSLFSRCPQAFPCLSLLFSDYYNPRKEGRVPFQEGAPEEKKKKTSFSLSLSLFVLSSSFLPLFFSHQGLFWAWLLFRKVSPLSSLFGQETEGKNPRERKRRKKKKFFFFLSFSSSARPSQAVWVRMKRRKKSSCLFTPSSRMDAQKKCKKNTQTIHIV